MARREKAMGYPWVVTEMEKRHGSRGVQLSELYGVTLKALLPDPERAQRYRWMNEHWWKRYQQQKKEEDRERTRRQPRGAGVVQP